MTAVGIPMRGKRKGNFKPKGGAVEKARVNHKVKARGPSAETITKKGKGTKSDTNVPGEQTFCSKADGKPLKKSLNNVYKILSASTCRNWYEFNATNALWGTAGMGFLTLNSYQSAAGSTLTQPLHVIDLSAVNDTVNGTVTQPTVGWYYTPSSETASATPAFTALPRSNTVMLQNTVGETTNSDSYPGSEDMHLMLSVTCAAQAG